MNKIGFAKVLICILVLLGSIGYSQQAKKAQLRDFKDVRSPSTAPEWTMKCRAWFETTKSLMELADCKSWKSGTPEDLEVITDMFVSEMEAISDLLDTNGLFDKLATTPYAIGINVQVLTLLNKYMNTLEYTYVYNPLYDTQMSEKLRLQIMNHCIAGKQLELGQEKHLAGLSEWYELTAPIPKW